MVIARVEVPVPLLFVAPIVTSVVPKELGVPVITPVLVLRDKPAGSGAAPKDVGELDAVIV
jgi:hypothetical protein